MLKVLLGIVVVLLIAAAMALFTSLNPGTIEVDLAFGTVQSSIPMAFVVAFALGWAFGLLCTAYFILRLANDRRRLRRQLRLTESEVSSLRSLPIADAD